METKKLSLMDAITEVSQEREIEKEQLISVLENSILQAAQRKYTNFDAIEVTLDQKTGDILLFQYKKVVDEPEDTDNEVSFVDAKSIDSSAEIGDEIAYPIPTKDFSNTIAQATRYILFTKVRDIEREIISKKFEDKIMEIVHGKVARIEANRVYVILSTNIEGILERNEMLWNDKFQSGEIARALLLDIRQEGRQHALVLSRTHPEFLVKLLTMEIPEIFDGSITIEGIAREAGRKSKIVVKSEDPDIDPVGACIGPRGSRISPIITELNGERIDILAWKDNPAEFISEALNVEGIRSITLDEDNSIAFVEIHEEFLPAAIGKKGQNVRLAQKITDVQIKFVPYSAESERKEMLSGLFKEPQSQDASSSADDQDQDSQFIASAAEAKQSLEALKKSQSQVPEAVSDNNTETAKDETVENLETAKDSEIDNLDQDKE